MRIAFYDSNMDNEPTSLDIEWSELAEGLAESEPTPCTPCPGKNCPSKFGRAWSPVDIKGSRANANVRAITAAVFDIDGIDDLALESVLTTCADYAYILHSTHSHRPGINKIRLVLQLSRPVLATHWRAFLARIVHDLDIPTDPACKDVSRLYFFPTHPSGSETLFECNEGKAVDVDAVLASIPPSDVARAPAAIVESDEPTDLDDLRKSIAAARKRKASSTEPDDAVRYHNLGSVLNGTSLAEDGARDITINRTSAMLAFALPAGTPTEAFSEIMRACVSAMPCEPEGFEHWMDRARSSYDRAMSRRIEKEAQRKEIDDRIRRQMLALVPSSSGPTKSITDTSNSLTETGNSDENGDAWKTELIFRADAKIKSCGANVVLILSRSAETRGTIRFNEVSKTIEVRGGPFDGTSQEVLAVRVADWFEKTYNISIGAQEVGQRIAYVAWLNRYDPLADYLNGLEWDGVSRCAKFLTDYCGAVCSDAEGYDIGDHIGRMSIKWMVSAVARALAPGCQVDTVLVIEGRQGIRKTSALRALAGDWFCDTQLILGDKDSKMLAASAWIIEMPELASMKKGETEAQKAFFSSPRDKYRKPYASALSDCPRRCVFVGTTNEEGYLVDRTGNRRFWPVRCKWINITGIEADRDQLWAEAVHHYKTGMQWWFDSVEQKIADTQTEERMGESATEEKIASWWSSLHPSKRPAHMTTVEVAEALLYSFERINRAVQTDIGTALKRLGFNKTRKTVNTRLTYVYTPSDELKNLPQGGHRSPLQLVVGAKGK